MKLDTCMVAGDFADFCIFLDLPSELMAVLVSLHSEMFASSCTLHQRPQLSCAPSSSLQRSTNQPRRNICLFSKIPPLPYLICLFSSYTSQCVVIIVLVTRFSNLSPDNSSKETLYASQVGYVPAERGILIGHRLLRGP